MTGDTWANRIRVSAKALIISDGKLLVIRHEDSGGVYHTLPGGGQRPFETQTAALVRECQEELGATVRVGALRFVREYIGRHHEFAHKDGETHQVECIFDCRLVGDYIPASGDTPDATQTGVVWIPLSALAEHRLYPAALRKLLHSAAPGAVYIGDVN